MTRKEIAEDDKAKIRKGFIADIVANDIFDLLDYAMKNNVWKNTQFELVAFEKVKNLEVSHNVVRLRTWRKNIEIIVKEVKK